MKILLSVLKHVCFMLALLFWLELVFFFYFYIDYMSILLILLFLVLAGFSIYVLFNRRFSDITKAGIVFAAVVFMVVAFIIYPKKIKQPDLYCVGIPVPGVSFVDCLTLRSGFQKIESWKDLQ